MVNLPFVKGALPSKIGIPVKLVPSSKMITLSIMQGMRVSCSRDDQSRINRYRYHTMAVILDLTVTGVFLLVVMA